MNPRGRCSSTGFTELIRVLYKNRRCLLAAMLAANSVPVTVEALLFPNKLAAPPAYAFPAVQKAAANKMDC